MGFLFDMKPSTVGKSSRTPYKHWLYNSQIGKMLGAQSTGKTPCGSRFTIIDLCAGDGIDTYGDRSSSPSIAHHHINHPCRGRVKITKRAFLFEKQQNTFDKLKARYGSDPRMILNCADSKGVTLRDFDIQKNESVFVYADPNSISTLPIIPELLESFTDNTLFLMTLGCNVGGSKRRDPGERMAWKGIVEMSIQSISRRHDCHLISLNRDASQWAYLAAIPNKWSQERLNFCIAVGNKMWPNGVDGASYRSSPAIFRRMLARLFSTEKELQSS